MKKKLLYSLLFFCCLSFRISGQEIPVNRFYFNHYGLEQGLSQSSVLCILQDQTGFMWFGTKDGLNRFDGISFKIFSRDGRDNSIGNNVINSLCEGGNGDIWIGTDDGVFIYHPLNEKFSRFELKASDNMMISGPVLQISQYDKNIWFATESEGFFSYNSISQKLIHYPLKIEGETASNIVNSFCIDKENIIWFGVRSKGLFYADLNFNKIHPFISVKNRNEFENDIIFKIVADDYNSLLIGSALSGFNRIDLVKHNIEKILPPDNRTFFVRNILKLSPNEYWIASENGIYIYYSDSKKFVHLLHDPDNPYSISDNAIYAIFPDREGGLWIGSYFGGIDYLLPKYAHFEKFFPKLKDNSIRGRVVREFCEDINGNIWIGTEDGGLNIFNIDTEEFTQFSDKNLYHNIHAICLDGDNLWVGTFSMGLYKLNIKKRIITDHFLKTNDTGSIIDNNIYALCKTNSGDLYIGTPEGLSVFEQNSKKFVTVDELNGVFVFDIFEDNDGYIWFASYNSGIFVFNPRNKSWKHYINKSNVPNSLPYNKVISIFEDSKKQLWFTFQGEGFCKFDKKSEKFIQYLKNNLPNKVIYKILEDNKGNLWMTSNKGLICFNPQLNTLKNYTTLDGLTTNQFNYSSGIKTKDGKLYFGGINGFIRFNPDNFKENLNTDKIVITDLFIFNKRVYPEVKNSPLLKNINYVNKVKLKYNQNSFAFRFVSLSYAKKNTDHLIYKLEGFDKEWQMVPDNPMAIYTNIKPGKYVFYVKLGTPNNTANFKKIDIIITPPLWATTFAYMIYLLLFSFVVWIFYNRFINQLHRKHQYQLEKFETEKEREIYRAKIDFFTNIAHEIRTPLTLIKGPLENILRKNNLSVEMKEDMEIMNKNTSRLLNLTNQLLDFRKTEANDFRLNLVKQNVSELIRDTSSRFKQISKERNLELRLLLPENDFYAPIDIEAITKILSNLLTNALKFAQTFIEISLNNNELDNNYFIISVSNDGPKIPNNMSEEIFKPFVQLRQPEGKIDVNGTGIGLPLARSLAELHNGKLYLSEVSENTCFIVELPINQKNVVNLDNKTFTDKEMIVKSFNNPNSEITILVVEDDLEMLSFISNQIKDYYSVICAKNGVEAINFLENNEIDVVISDIMMPEMDGFELCKKLKSDIAHSHIPVVLLTAKANLQAKIEGIEIGADDYIEKPFSTEYLLARIKNLLISQERRYKALTMPFFETKSIALTKTDEIFLDKLTEVINKNISELNFNVDLMAEQMNMSRSSLHRKIKGLTNQTPNDYIQLERLKKAAQLISSGEYRVNEVCYIVGFNSPSYFTRCFQKQFGALPKDFMKKNVNPKRFQ